MRMILVGKNRIYSHNSNYVGMFKSKEFRIAKKKAIKKPHACEDEWLYLFEKRLSLSL